MDKFVEKVVGVSCSKHPKKIDHSISYGTAGFRTNSNNLDHIMFRMGVLATLRSKLKNKGIGVMITASHNPEEDNGVKLVDPMGEMLEMTWEKYATQLANASDDTFGDALKAVIEATQVNLDNPAKVLVARDTRSSSKSLSESVQDGIAACSADALDFGLLSTPQLHYIVRCYNTNSAYGVPTETGYYEKLSKAFQQFRGQSKTNGQYKPDITIDGANGVGALKIKAMQKHLGNMMNIEVVNDGSSGKLNYMCGADFVKVQQKFPNGVTVEKGKKYCSFDGDADRIVFFYADENGTFHLLDGDKIATLIVGIIMKLVKQSQLELEVGIVQTAYANGSSTAYIEKTLNIPVAFAKTGVKYVHHKAAEYDIGVYFEANGHGTALFSETTESKIKESCAKESLSQSQRESAQQLLTLLNLTNQTVGDAISDFLLVETVLHYNGWSIEDWNKSYTDLPNRQLKVKVADRTVVQTTDAERKATSPEGLQHAVNELVSQYPNGRSFVRPSGTEDVVRVYAESDTQANADDLAKQVAGKVYDLAGGVGDRP